MRSSPDVPRRFTFVLAEAALELVPELICGERAVVAHARSRRKRASSILLDSSFHHSAMRSLADWERRGRPDIAHLFLLLCLDSRLNLLGRLRTIVHTRNDERITFSPETRLPPSYHRFVGLMESLFQNRVLPSRERPLLSIEERWTLPDIVRAEGCDRAVLLDVEGDADNPASFLASRGSENTAVLIGGFPTGSVRSDIASLPVERLSLGGEMLKVWTVTSEMLVASLRAATAP